MGLFLSLYSVFQNLQTYNQIIINNHFLSTFRSRLQNSQTKFVCILIISDPYSFFIFIPFLLHLIIFSPFSYTSCICVDFIHANNIFTSHFFIIVLILQHMNYQAPPSLTNNRLKRTLAIEDKRNIFAQSIRQQQRQLLMNSMRQQIRHIMPLEQRDPYFKNHYLQQLHCQWIQAPENMEIGQQISKYILQTKGRTMQKQSIACIKDLSTYINKLITNSQKSAQNIHLFCNAKDACECRCSGCRMMTIMVSFVNELQQVFRLQSLNTDNRRIDKCYYQLVECCCLLAEYLPVWEYICLVCYDSQFALYCIRSFANFMHNTLFCQFSLQERDMRIHHLSDWETDRLNSAQQDDKTINIVLSIVKTYLCQLAEQPQKTRQFLHQCINILNQLGSVFILNNEHLLEFINATLLILEIAQSISASTMDQMISQLAVKTPIYKNICQSTLDNKQLRNQQLGLQIIARSCLLVGRLFASEQQQLSNQVYISNVLIFKHLRMWLPLPPGPITPSANQSIAHPNNQLTRNIIYAFSNIAATNLHYIELFTTTDILSTILHLYKISSVSIRVEISHTLYNMFYIANSTLMTTILSQSKQLFFDVIRQMFEEKNPIILRNSMDVIVFICQGLPNTMPQKFAKKEISDHMNALKFAAEIQKNGCYSLLESHLSSKAEGVSENANKALKIVEDTLNSYETNFT